MIEQRDNRLWIDGCSAEDLAARYGTPLFVMSEEHMSAKCAEIRRDFLEKYPGSRAAFAGKAFITLAMCRFIEAEGFCLDVVSGGELYTAIKAGFPPERIEFNGNNKSPEEIRMAVEYGVGRIIVDGIDEIPLIESVCSELGKKASILLRISPGVDSHTHEFITTGKKDSKFGIPLDDGIFHPVFQASLSSSCLDLLGFHFHVGSQLHDNESHLKAASILLDIIRDVKERYGFQTSELNIGGGFGIRYTDEDDEKPYAYFLDAVMETILQGFSAMEMAPPAVVIEPGRSIVGNAGVTLYTVGTVKDIPGVRKYVSVDGGMTDNIRPALYDSRYEAVLAGRTGETPSETVTVCGKCCESGDIILKDILLPPARRGDLLAVFSTGAYCYTMASNYNKLPFPAVVFTRNGESRPVVRRQTYDDLINREL